MRSLLAGLVCLSKLILDSELFVAVADVVVVADADADSGIVVGTVVAVVDVVRVAFGTLLEVVA